MNNLSIDIRTLLLVSSIIFLCRAALLAYAWAINRSYLPIRYWAIGSSLAAFGVLMLSLRGMVPLPVSVMLGQAGLLLGWMMISAGTVAASGRTPPWRWGYSIALAALAGAFCFLLVWPDDLLRSIVVSLPGLMFDSYTIYACLRFVGDHARTTTFRVLALALSMSIVSTLVKNLYMIRSGSSSMFDATAPNSQYFVLGVVNLVVCTVLYVLLAAQKSQEDLAQEIEQRKKAEQLLLESEAHQQAIVDNEPECIKIMDAQGLLVQMNPAGLAMIEADSLAQVKGTPILPIIAPEYREAFMAMHQRVIAGEPGKMEFEVLGLKGGRRMLETHAVPMKIRGETVQLAITRDVTERKQMEERVRQFAYHDALTNLPNRRLLLDRLGRAMAASKRSGCYCALLFLDLDHFKPLNDAHGHETGDVLLIEVARRLTSSVRGVDTVSRFGGDEFAVLLGELIADKAQSTKEVAIIAEKIRINLAETYLLPVRHEGRADTTVEHRCSASIGAVVFLNHECSQEDILKWADAAMYKAKDAGRNTVVFHEADAG